MNKLIYAISFFMLVSYSAAGQCNPPNYCGYTGTDIVLPAVPPPSLGTLNNNNGLVYDTSFASHGALYSFAISRCTDQNSSPGTAGLAGYSAGDDGAGDAVEWNTTSTLIHIETNSGGSAIALFNPSTMVCSKLLTEDKNLTLLGSSSVRQDFGDGQFSASNQNVWWAFGVVGNIVKSNTVVTPVTFTNLNTGTFTVGGTVVDFRNGLPLSPNILAWQPNTAYSFGAYVTYTLTANQYKTWAPSTTFNAGDIIWPDTTQCAFVVKTSGKTGAMQPMWPACNGNANTITDGTVIWRSMVGGASFVFELVSASGTSGTATPAFVPASGHPDVMSMVSDNGMTWENIGVDVLQPVWHSIPKVSPDGTKFAHGFSTNTYGSDPTASGGYNGVCTYASCSGDQGTGQFAITYDATANLYNLFNTETGIQTQITCVKGTGYACTGGVFAWATLGKAAAAPCPFFLHGTGGTADALHVTLSAQNGYNQSGCPLATDLLWNVYQPFTAATQVVPFRAAIDHKGAGFNHLSFIGQDGTLYGFQSGAYAVSFPYNDVVDDPPIVFQAYPCAVSWSGGPIAPCMLQMDSHLSWVYNPGDDSTPVFGTTFNKSLQYSAGPNPVAAWQNEVIGYTSSPSWSAIEAPPPAAAKIYRFTHTFATQSNRNFSVWYAIGQSSQDGQFYAWGSDWGAGFGSTTGLPPVLPITNLTVTCLGGYLWQSNTKYVLGAVINPVPSLNGGGSPYDVYQAVAITTGISGTTIPNWASTKPGNQLVDNGVTWQDVAPGNCRGDVVIVRLTPNVSAPNPPTALIATLE
jgi:hypothetical protein